MSVLYSRQKTDSIHEDVVGKMFEDNLKPYISKLTKDVDTISEKIISIDITIWLLVGFLFFFLIVFNVLSLYKFSREKNEEITRRLIEFQNSLGQKFSSDFTKIDAVLKQGVDKYTDATNNALKIFEDHMQKFDSLIGDMELLKDSYANVLHMHSGDELLSKTHEVILELTKETESFPSLFLGVLKLINHYHEILCNIEDIMLKNSTYLETGVKSHESVVSIYKTYSDSLKSLCDININNKLINNSSPLKHLKTLPSCGDF